ncbi:hypothetical protein ERE07_10695 [Allopusillimonas ginsengisoli]|nr:hypothetical protein ERE07_10695 [Allopusillimonas ginsengisoli]
MTFPAFFNAIPAIIMQDPLAQLLGAADAGLIEYTYADTVKLAGHSCPTVAGAYLMTTKALKRLYPDQPPLRGGIKVQFRDSQAKGVTGVIANVTSFITGATTDNGFKGIRGKHDRRNLLFFDVPIQGDIRFERLDTGASVTVSFDASQVPSAPELMPSLLAATGDNPDPAQQERFAQAWQDRVRRIFEQADQPGLVQFY